MSDSHKYIFKIKDLKPDTIPFGRLLTYYQEISKMIGMADHMHLVDIRESSHASQFVIDPQYMKAVDERLFKLSHGAAPKKSQRARDQINQMLREDCTSAEFSAGAGEGATIIQFPGKLSEDTATYAIRESVTLSGELYHISGTTDDVRVRISTDAYGVVFCIASKEMGRSLRDFLFEEVKIIGRGLWKRMADGTWSVNDVTITDFASRPKESLRTTVERIRKLDIDWPDDPIDQIEKIEERGRQYH